MRKYYASSISENIAETPEGYLVCKNVAISRTGKQIYYGYELGEDYEHDRQYPVFRTDREVFSEKAIASFEGKPVCNEHPDVDVTSENATHYTKGVTTNVRRGVAEDSDKLFADLVIYDQKLIEEIKNGKREISCGYDCLTITGEDNKLYQSSIRGNHVAIVESGRAGSAVCINDQQPKKQLFKRKEITMAKKSKKFWSNLFSTMKDADPEAVAEIVEEVIKQDEEPTNDNETATNDNECATHDNTNEISEILAAVTALTDQVKTLSDEVSSIKSDNSTNTDNDPLEQLEAELVEAVAEGGNNESDNSVDPAYIDEEPTNDEDTTDEDTTNDEDPIADNDLEDSDIIATDEDTTNDNEPTTSTADRVAVLREVRKMKPIIAKMKDKKAKKAMTDSLIRLAKPYIGGKKSNSYKKMSDAKRNNMSARQKAINDEKTINKSLQNAYNKRNPHINKESR